MPGPVPGIPVLVLSTMAWVAGTSPAMTTETTSPRQPLGDALLRVGAGFRVGPDVAAFWRRRIRPTPDRVQRKIRPIEIVARGRIDYDARQRAAAAGAVDHLLAGRRR